MSDNRQVRRIAAAVAAAALAAFVWARYGLDNPGAVTSEAVLVTTFAGLATGARYAPAATGLVVAYSTTGVFNFAHGAIGVVGAFAYWELHERSDGLQLHSLLALVIVVVGLAPLIGVALDRVLMRRLQTATLVVQLMVTVGLMVFFLVLVGTIWPGTEARSVDQFFGSSGFDLGAAKISWHRLIVVLTAVIVAVGLRVFLHRTRSGIAMRAVVDNRQLTELNGARANRLSATAWALGSSLAALAGILIAPELEFNPQNLNDIIVVALAAAAIGQLKSLPLTVAGALAIGLLQRHSDLWLDLQSDFPFAVRSIAPIALFVAVLALPQSRLEVGRVAANLRPHERTTNWWEGMVGSTAIVVAALVLANGWLNFGFWDPGAWSAIALNNGIAAMALALIALSLVPLTGWAGQVNFAPLAFAGFGAWVYLKFSGGDGDMLWIPVVGVLTAPLGALVALPAARLRGLYLALMTIAFAQLMSTLFFPHREVFAAAGSGTQFKPLHLFGWNVDSRYRLFVVIVTAVAFTIFLLVLLRRSRFGRRWVALSESPAASATVGVNVVWTKVVVYAFSAAIAGMAGVFWATSKGAMDVRDFELLKGLELVLLMAAAGMSIPAAGLFLSFRFVFAALAERLEDTGSVPWLVWAFDEILVPFGPGMLAIGMVVNQRGAIFEMGRGFAPLLPWRSDAREDQSAERAAKREPEVGELGLSRPFTSDDVVGIDRRLGIAGDV